jgi:hypothetical protein
MNKINTIMIILSTLLLTQFSISCKADNAGDKTNIKVSINNKGSNILLANEDTRFKNQLVEAMTGLLEAGSATVTLVDHEKGGLEGLNAADYDMVFITASGVNSAVRPWILTWLAAQENTDNIILHVTQTRSWDVGVDIDTITSASDVGGVKEMAAEYVEKINAAIEAAAGQ